MSTKLIKNIEALGKMRGENLKQIGKNSGVGENAIYRWDKHEPKLSTITKCGWLLGSNYSIPIQVS